MKIKEVSRNLETARAAALAIALSAFAAQAAVSGSIEAGFNRNLARIDTVAGNSFHSYDAVANTFTLNNAHVILSGADSATGLGYDVETDFGSDAMVNRALDPSLGAADVFDLQEAYLTWMFGPGKAYGIKAGKYATYEGIEVIEGGSNPTVTRGLLFGLAEPVTHTGLEVNGTFGKADVHLGVINGWDRLVDDNGLPSYLAKVGLNFGDPLALTVSGILGPETPGATDNTRMSVDVTAITKAIKRVDLWLQFNYGMEDKAGVAGKDASWLGFGVQPLVHVNKWFGLGLRYEFFNDDKLSRVGLGLAAPAAGDVPAGPLAGKTSLSLQDISVAPTFWLTQTALLRAEYRVDFAGEKVFADGDGKYAKTQMELAGDFVLGF